MFVHVGLMVSLVVVNIERPSHGPLLSSSSSKPKLKQKRCMSEVSEEFV